MARPAQHRRDRNAFHASLLCLVGVVAVSCQEGRISNPISSPSLLLSPPQSKVVLVGAGDVADCANAGGGHAEATARLLDEIDGAVFAAGDLAYPDGSAERFNRCYDPRWGRHKGRTRPAAGNHEYETSGAFPYFDYFGAAAGPRGLGYYSYTLGAWHIVVLNSNIAADAGSAQWAWLRDDLRSNRALCSAAYWHHPRFTSGPSGGRVMGDVWRVLYESDVEIVLNGHDHGYERFAMLDPDGRRDPVRGIREFVVGTGGAPLYPFVSILPTSDARISNYGVLKLTLRPQSYDWAFLEAGTGAVLDSGLAYSCH